MNGRRGAWALTTALLAASCGPRQAGPPQIPRVATPAGLTRTLEAASAHGRLGWTFAPLTPSARARDLEVLLFSSGSTAYDGYVLRASSLSVLRPWLRPVEPVAAGALREGLGACVPVQNGRWLALPLTVDAVAFASREEDGVPERMTLEALDRWAGARAFHGEGEPTLGSTVPPLELFWALAHGEGVSDLPGEAVYGAPQIRALAFLQRHGLEPPPDPQEAVDAFLEGRRKGVFVWASEVKDLVARARSAGVSCRVTEAPHRGETARTLYGGYVWACPSSVVAPRDGVALLGPAVQETLALAGHLPAAAGLPAQNVEAERALSRTRLVAPPDLGPRGQEILEGALMDALDAEFSAEEALRRAQARIAHEAAP
ncbi:MAG: hypothetical protein ACOYXN_01370 [Acidobacteriota bacterium]